jgi:glucan 1,3-beta-glucosidase
MRLRSLLALPLLFGRLSHAIAIPAVDSAADGIHARHGDHGNQAGLESRALTKCAADVDGPEFWLESIAHQGISPFGPSGYKVFRNVKDFGAKGEWTASVLP